MPKGSKAGQSDYTFLLDYDNWPTKRIVQPMGEDVGPVYEVAGALAATTRGRTLLRGEANK